MSPFRGSNTEITGVPFVTAASANRRPSGDQAPDEESHCRLSKCGSRVVSVSFRSTSPVRAFATKSSMEKRFCSDAKTISSPSGERDGPMFCRVPLFSSLTSSRASESAGRVASSTGCWTSRVASCQPAIRVSGGTPSTSLKARRRLPAPAAAFRSLPTLSSPYVPPM